MKVKIVTRIIIARSPYFNAWREIVGHVQETEKERAAKQKHQPVANERIFEGLRHGCEEIDLFGNGCEFYGNALVATDFAELLTASRTASSIDAEVTEVTFAFLAFVLGKILIVIFAIDRFLLFDS
jgi:hypothetical protein